MFSPYWCGFPAGAPVFPTGPKTCGICELGKIKTAYHHEVQHGSVSCSPEDFVIAREADFSLLFRTTTDFKFSLFYSVVIYFVYLL